MTVLSKNIHPPHPIILYPCMLLVSLIALAVVTYLFIHLFLSFLSWSLNYKLLKEFTQTQVSAWHRVAAQLLNG